MALIDIDRHILLDVASQHNEMKLLIEKFSLCWFDIVEVRDKTEVLLFTQKDSPERHAELDLLRHKIFNATVEGAKLALQIREKFDKSTALVQFLVQSIEKVDTGNGREKGGHENKPEIK